MLSECCNMWCIQRVRTLTCALLSDPAGSPHHLKMLGIKDNAKSTNRILKCDKYSWHFNHDIKLNK
eukprot:1181902-Prorocentrum_minimum.AAC.1